MTWSIGISDISGSGRDRVTMALLSSDDFVKKARAVHGNQYEYPGSYLGANTEIVIICPTHGAFFQLPSSHIRGCGCTRCSGRYKPTQDEFIQKARLVHGDRYEYEQYANSSTKMEIICPIHGRFSQLPSTHLRGKGCGKCSSTAPLSQDEFIQKARSVHGDRYEYGHYVNSSTKIEIICPVHGSVYQLPKSHLTGCGCIKCSGKHAPTQDEFIQKARLVHGDRYEYGEYRYTMQVMPIICPYHGEFLQRPNDHLRGIGCPHCAGNVVLSQDEFIQKARSVHGDRYEYGCYVNSSTKMEIVCQIHGTFMQSPDSHVHQSTGCPRCAANRYSKKSIMWLNHIALCENIEILHAENNSEFKIEGIGFVDGYCAITNTIYEFHGDYWHGHPSKFEACDTHPVCNKTYGELYNTTIARDQKIRDMGYNLITIWEHEWDTIVKENKKLIKS